MTAVDPRTSKVLHPAKFSDPILAVLDRLVRAEQRSVGRPITVLDPFAGVGRVHKLARSTRDGEPVISTIGVEIQPSWAGLHERTICADSLDWMARIGPGYTIPAPLDDRPEWWLDGVRNGGFVGFDVVVTSPTYGNRFADHHDAQDGSTRRSYAHDLRAMGDEIVDGNSGVLAWGPPYWQFHAEAYRLIEHVLRPGGLFLLNVSDFVKGKAVVPAATWHRGAAHGAGFVERERPRVVETARYGYGENRDERAPGEVIYRLRAAS